MVDSGHLPCDSGLGNWHGEGSGQALPLTTGATDLPGGWRLMTGNSAVEFDYEAGATIQGRGEVSSTDRNLAGMRLARCLEVLARRPGPAAAAGLRRGRHVRAIRRERPALTVHGSDLSLTGVREAVRYRDGAHYTVADALALPYRDAAFDIVVLFDLLEHVPDVGRALDEIARVLRPAGLSWLRAVRSAAGHAVRPALADRTDPDPSLEARPCRPHPAAHRRAGGRRCAERAAWRRPGAATRSTLSASVTTSSTTGGGRRCATPARAARRAGQAADAGDDAAPGVCPTWRRRCCAPGRPPPGCI